MIHHEVEQLDPDELAELKQEFLKEQLEPVTEEEEFYDTTPEEDFGPPQLNPNLTEWEIEDALWILKIFGFDRGHGLYGLAVATGEIGSGKDLMLNQLSWKCKRYFDKTIFRDERPRQLFGPYVLFDEMTIFNLIAQMRTLDKEYKKWSMTRILSHWYETMGEKKFVNSVLYLTEFHKWMNNRDCHNPISKMLGKIIKRARHTNCLIVGSTPEPNELDFKLCLQYINKQVRCKHNLKKSTICNYTITPVKFSLQRGRLLPTGNPAYTFIDGARPREQLGGKNYFNLYNSKSRTVG